MQQSRKMDCDDPGREPQGEVSRNLCAVVLELTWNTKGFLGLEPGPTPWLWPWWVYSSQSLCFVDPQGSEVNPASAEMKVLPGSSRPRRSFQLLGCLLVWMPVYLLPVCVCVCVCDIKRQRDTQRKRNTGWDREKQRKREGKEGGNDSANWLDLHLLLLGDSRCVYL